MTQYQPIDCGDYDMLEIACLDRYDINVELEDSVVTGMVAGLETRDGAEYLRVRTPAGGDESIRIDRIRSLTVLTRPARFDMHTFSRPAP